MVAPKKKHKRVGRRPQYASANELFNELAALPDETKREVLAYWEDAFAGEMSADLEFCERERTREYWFHAREMIQKSIAAMGDSTARHSAFAIYDSADDLATWNEASDAFADTEPFLREGALPRWDGSLPSTNPLEEEMFPSQKHIHPVDHLKRMAFAKVNARPLLFPQELYALEEDIALNAGGDQEHDTLGGTVGHPASSRADLTERNARACMTQCVKAHARQSIEQNIEKEWAKQRAFDTKRQQYEMKKRDKQIIGKHYVRESEFEGYSYSPEAKQCWDELRALVFDRYGDAKISWWQNPTTASSPSSLDVIIASKETDEFGLPEIHYHRRFPVDMTRVGNDEFDHGDLPQTKHLCDTVAELRSQPWVISEISQETWETQQSMSSAEALLFGVAEPTPPRRRTSR